MKAKIIREDVEMKTTTKAKATKVNKVLKSEQPDPSLIPAITELERMRDLSIGWLKQCGMTIPESVKFVINIAPARNRINVLAWYGDKTRTEGSWTDKYGVRYPEINFSAEHLMRPAQELYATMVHEVLHGYNAYMRIKDTSNNGVYHNRKWKLAAEQADLQFCHPEAIDGKPNKKSGWGITKAGPMLEADMLLLSLNDDAFTLARDQIKSKAAKKKKKTMYRWTCGCTKVWASTDVESTCTKSDCGERFQLDEEIDEEGGE